MTNFCYCACSLLNPLIEQLSLLSFTILKSFSLTTMLTFSVPFPPSHSLLAYILVKKFNRSVPHLLHYPAIKLMQLDCIRPKPTGVFTLKNVLAVSGPQPGALAIEPGPGAATHLTPPLIGPGP